MLSSRLFLASATAVTATLPPAWSPRITPINTLSDRVALQLVRKPIRLPILCLFLLPKLPSKATTNLRAIQFAEEIRKRRGLGVHSAQS